MNVLLSLTPTEWRGLGEVLVLVLTYFKFPALALAVGAAVLAYQLDKEGNKDSAAIAVFVAGGAVGAFLGGLAV